MSINPEHREQSLSIWQLTAEPVEFASLDTSAFADVCVVGAGIAGLSVAYEIVASGRSVIVIDDSRIGAGMTGRTTAHLVNALDDRYYELERLHGEEKTRLAAESHTAAIERISAIVREEKIDCDFERLEGYLFNPPGESGDLLEREFEAATRAGVSIQRVERAPMGDFNTGPALRFLSQGQFHPIKYLTGLAAAIERRGGRIYTGTHAVKIEGGKTARVTTANGHTITAGSVVVATNTPVNDRYVIHTKQAPYTTYVIGIPVLHGTVRHALYWDTAQEAGQQKHGGPAAYHYVRLQRAGDHDVLIVGGEDHKTGQTDDFEAHFQRLESWARSRFPCVGDVEYRWSGQVMEPLDGMAFIGHNPADDENVYLATGDSGTGITHGVIAGMLIRDLITGHSNPWKELYEPGRITPKAAGEFLRENLNVAAQLRHYVTKGDVASASEVETGCGAVVREGLSKVAIYRDDDGVVHRLSAICPHLKCVVNWNSAERIWDCPCHGSRFDALGTVISGPAISNLETL
ncbi:MAG: dependent oxidoreductase [Chthoniobacteraceae bacterium]|nr:dependent oxidoreductase [Chthoniobacteraceae bacterium]